MAEVTDYTKYLPLQPPEGYLEWVLDNNRLGGDYIIYRQGSRYEPLEERMKRAVLCRCTACGKEYHLDYFPSSNKYKKFGFIHPENKLPVFSRSECKCPVCGSKVTAMHCTEFGTKYDSNIAEFFGFTVERVLDGIALFCWCTVRNINRSGCDAYNTYPYEAYLFTKTERIRFNGRGYNGCGHPYFTGTWRQLQQFKDKVGEFSQSQIFPWDPSILDGTAAENCKLDVFINSSKKVFPVSYMYLWHRYPNIENLVMQGWGKYINDKIEETIPSYYDYYPYPSRATKGLHMTKAKPTEILGLSKEECKYIKKHKWQSDKISFYILTHNKGITFENIDAFLNHKSEVLHLADYPVNIPRALRYIEKQNRKWGKTNGASYLADYWNMAKYNGDSLKDDKILFPHNLERAHNTAVREMNIRKAEEAAKRDREKAEKSARAFATRYAELKQYCYSDSGLSIHPCVDELEMITEGKILDHCVASYARQHEKGETSIYIFYPSRGQALRAVFYAGI